MLKRATGIALLLLILGGGFALTPPSPFISSEREQAAQQNQARQTAAQKPQDVLDAEKADDRLARYTLWLTVFTGVLAVSTIGLWIVTWRSGIKQGRDMRASIAVSARQAAASERANEIASAAMIAADRPWLGIETIDIDPLEVGKPFHAVIKFKNFGRSPAVRSRGYAQYTLRMPEQPPLEIPNAFPPDASVASVMPNGSMTKEIITDDAPTQVWVDRINSGQRILWMAFLVEYFDQLGGRHVTTSRGRYLPRSNSVLAMDGEAT